MTAPRQPPEIAVWQRLLGRMDRWEPGWRELTGDDTPPPPASPAGGTTGLSNEAAFEAFAVALLSGNTRWDRIERIRDDLREPFQDFSPGAFAALSDRQIGDVLIPWFRERRAGAAGLRAALSRLRQTARILAGESGNRGARQLIEAGLAQASGSPEALAMLFGSAGAWKLPGFGIALAAEALRLLGFDLCKPDRHVLRAIGSWRFVEFARWDRKGAFTAPQARPAELLATMLAVRRMAEANGVGVSHACSVIWLAGAVSGARLANSELEALAAGEQAGEAGRRDRAPTRT